MCLSAQPGQQETKASCLAQIIDVDAVQVQRLVSRSRKSGAEDQAKERRFCRDVTLIGREKSDLDAKKSGGLVTRFAIAKNAPKKPLARVQPVPKVSLRPVINWNLYYLPIVKKAS